MDIDNVQIMFIMLQAFFAVFIFVLSVAAFFRKEDKRPENLRKPWVFRFFSKEIENFASILCPTVDHLFAEQEKRIRNDIIVSALPLESREIHGLQGLACFGAGVMGCVLVFTVSMNGGYALLAGSVGGLVGWIWPVTYLHGMAAARQEQMSRSMPFAIDLITVAMQAGQDFGAAVRNLVGGGMKGPLADEFTIMLRQTELGKSRVEALKAMSERLQLDEFRSLVTAVAQSADMGASISQTLKIQAEEIRRARYHAAERKAARAPSLMLLPMALFIMPAVFIIIFTPVVIKMMDSGVGAMFGAK
jgi:tight adherence protein C